MTQRLKIQAVARRGREAHAVAEYLGQLAADEGAKILSVKGIAKKRGGGIQVVADATDAVAVMKALRAKVDGDANGYLLDTLEELAVAAFESGNGGFLGFVNENYRVMRS